MEVEFRKVILLNYSSQCCGHLGVVVPPFFSFLFFKVKFPGSAWSIMPRKHSGCFTFKLAVSFAPRSTGGNHSSFTSESNLNQTPSKYSVQLSLKMRLYIYFVAWHSIFREPRQTILRSLLYY